MEIPTITGILRKSPELARSPTTRSYHGETSISSTVTAQDKGCVRFSEGDIGALKMNTKLLTTPVEKVRFTYDKNPMESTVPEEEDDEDYSASVNAIIQRRVSSKRRKRRSSSPFSHEDFSAQSTPRRRSSGFTVTSLDTTPSTEESGIREEQIYENIRLHKEVIANVKQQPWPIRRKLKLLQQAKAYVKRHEGELQVRLKQSRSTKDILTRFNILIIKKWQHTKREIINFMNLLIPWELRIKEIESHFGTVVASYFTFLRWLFWVNLVISIILTAFVIVPEILVNKNRGGNDERRNLQVVDDKKLSLDVLLNFEGVLKYSPIFYGYYSNKEAKNQYKVPIAYFMIGIGVYIYSFIAILRKMAVNFRLSKLSEKDDECIFTWKLFTGWDYMIGNAETGHNRTSSIVLGFKEALLEEAEKKKEKRSWKVISIRVFVNINVLWMLICSACTVIYVVDKSSGGRQEGSDKNESALVKWWKQNETTVVMTVIGSIFPFIFELFGLIEKYHPRKTLRIQLGRIMALNLLNLYTLTFALFNQIGGMNKELGYIRGNITNISTTAMPLGNNTNHSIVIPAVKPFILMEDSGRPSNIFDQIFNQVKNDSNNLNFSRDVLSTYQSNNSACTDTSCTGITSNRKSLPEEFAHKISHFTDPAQIPYPKPLPFIKSNRLINPKTLGEFENTIENYEQHSTVAMTSSEMFNETSSSDESSSEYISTEVSEWTTVTEFIGEDVDNTTNTDISVDKISSMAYTRSNDSEEISTTSKQSVTETSSTTAFVGGIPEMNSTNSSIVAEVTSTETVAVYDSSNSTKSTSSATPSNITSSLNETIGSVENFTVTYPPDGGNKTTWNKTNFPVIWSTPKPFTTTEINQVSMCQSQAKLSSIESDNKEDYSAKIGLLNKTQQEKLTRLCWETMFGQELVKLTVMDLAENIMTTFCGDFIRALLVRYLNKIWCWDLEKRFPKYADFKIAENILHLVNNQGLVWMGMFFSPGLPLINVVKLMIMMYLRSWAVLTCNVPHEVVFRASRSNNFYLALLLTMLFLCVLPVCYAIVWLEPSWHCGPFSGEYKIYRIFVRSLKNYTPTSIHVFMDYTASPGTVIPLLIILLLIIYYLASLTSALREANVDLKVQLRRERTEERKKMFQMASRRKRGGSDVDSTFAKWKKILQEVPSTRLSDDVAFPDGFDDVKKADDTDVDNGQLKHDEEEKQKIKKIFRSKNKTESTTEKKWGTLLRIVPKPQKENVVDKESTSTTSSAKDDTKSEIIPEIKISRVQTFENLLKNAEKLKQPVTPKIEEEQMEIIEETEPQIPKVQSILDRNQRRSNLKQIGKSARLDSDSDEIEDDVFLESVVVEVPEMTRITESISNRIKRRLKKVLSMGSNEETQQISESRKPSFGISSQAAVSDECTDSKMSIDKSGKNDPEPPIFGRALSEKDKRVLEYRRSKLVKSESMNMERDKKWRNYMQRRKSSLDDIHLHLPDV